MIVDEVKLEVGSETLEGQPYDADGNPVSQVPVPAGGSVNVRVEGAPELNALIRDRPPLHMEVRYRSPSDTTMVWWLEIDLEPALADTPGRPRWRVIDHKSRRA